MLKPNRIRRRIGERRDDESGIALIIVLLVLMLCAILAVEIKSSAAEHSRLAKSKRDDFLMREAMRGQLEIIKQVLIYDLTENKVETLEDSWADDKYTRPPYQSTPTEEEREDADPDEPVSSQNFDLEARVEDEARKFNLHNLNLEDEELRKHWRTVFVRLLMIYREEYPQYVISQGEAESIVEQIAVWMARKDEVQGVPRPSTADERRVMVTPDELLMIEGVTPEIFFDQRPDEGVEMTEIPGLCRYLTLWSAGQVNLNTADRAVVHALFTDADRDLADRLFEWREEESEDEADQPTSLDDDPMKNSLKSLGDLSKIEGFEAAVIQRNKLDGTTATVSGNSFSIHFISENEDGLRRQERWVLERNPAGVTTHLMEERNDPVYKDEEEE
jgi:hypothetical protein